jgi:glycosyltransferase involved in cell wall biosynthesis
MNTAPTVSIITPFLNLEKYLEATIQSVLVQDIQNWELLLIDDGSSDRSTDIAKQYAQQYPEQIIYLEHEGHSNKGPSVSRNYAMSVARGEWIAFLDGDDLFLPARLSTQLKLVEQYPQVTLFCEATYYWYSDADPAAQDKIIRVGVPDGLYKPMELTFLLYPMGKGDAPCMCGLLVKKDVLVTKGGFEESFRSLYGDQVILSKLYLDQHVFVTSDCNNWYRQRPGSIVQSHFDHQKYMQARAFFLRWFRNYLRENKAGNSRLYWLIWKYLLPVEHPKMYKIFLKIKQSLKLTRN